MPLYSISFAAQSANFLLEGQKVGDEGIKEEGEWVESDGSEA